MKRAPVRVDPDGAAARGAARGRPRTSARPPVGIQSVDIALEILAHLVDHGAGIGLSELSRLSGLPPSKLHRYLVSFTRRGLLRQSELTGQYDLGPFARSLGTAAFNRYLGLSAVHEAVAKIAEETRCATALYLWTELGPTLLRMQMGEEPMPVVLREGTALPLQGSATGRAFLAHLPSAATQSLLAQERALEREEGTATWSKAELARELEAIRGAPIYWTRETVVPGTLAVAPIFGERGTLHCVLVVIAQRGQAAEAQRGRIEKCLLGWKELLAKELA
jgi:DNA-binding IclR family transcriptional regulator